MAAWMDEITSRPLARTLLDDPWVLYRGADGKAVALQDRCPHRFAPLSAGKVVGNAIECGYHGLRFGADGACVANPHGAIVAALKVRSCIVYEVYRATWIWMGNPALADPSRIRDLTFLDEAPPNAFSKGYVLGKGNYQLFVDNILDLTHVDFLHPATLGGGALSQSRTTIKRLEEGISVRREANGVTPSPVMATRLQGTVDRVDTWSEVLWTAPAVMSLQSGATHAGAAQELGGSSLNVHIMTPETAKSTHYFYAATRNYERDNPEINRRIATLRDHIFSTEDEPMISKQQQRMGEADFWDLNPVLLRTDAGSVLVRRFLDKLIAAETQVTGSG